MSQSQEIPVNDFKRMVDRAGLGVLSDAELNALKALHDHFSQQVAPIHELDLGEEDLAVVYLPAWDPIE